MQEMRCRLRITAHALPSTLPMVRSAKCCRVQSRPSLKEAKQTLYRIPGSPGAAALAFLFQHLSAGTSAGRWSNFAKNAMHFAGVQVK